MKEKPVYPAILLGLLSLLAAGLLGGGNLSTREEIKRRLEEDLRISIAQVVPEDLHDNNLIQSSFVMNGPGGLPTVIYQGMRNGKITAVAYSVISYGYSGKIDTIMAVDPEGKILGVRVLSHTETPGLGDKIEASKSDWVLGFSGLSLDAPPAEQWAVKKDGGHFDQFSGATITPRAVVKAVKSGLDFFQKNKDKLLTPVTEQIAGSSS
ncbi:MAG: electron transport complex subunit RsxG [Proteobacteria bacterium]|jgi:electron transport complex protein RnfG|nr:MAG: electron transport complex subunit RsxG [Pseudomonadota bacterium]